MHVLLFLSLCLMPHKTITCQSAYIGLQSLVCGFPPSDPPHTSNLTRKQLHAKRCPCGLQSLVCVCVASLPLTHHTHKQFHGGLAKVLQHAWDPCCFKRSHLPHHKQNNYMSSCAYMGCNLLRVWFPSPSDPPHTSNSMPRCLYMGLNLSTTHCASKCAFFLLLAVWPCLKHLCTFQSLTVALGSH